MKAAGLHEIKRITVGQNELKCVLSVMQPLPLPALVPAPELFEGGGSSGSGGGSVETSIDEGIDARETGTSQGKRLVSKASASNIETVPRFTAGELVLGFIDDCSPDSTSSSTLRELLCSMTQEAEQLSLNSVGLVEEEVTVQPVLLSLAVEALKELTDFIAPAPAPAPAPSLPQEEQEEGVDVSTSEHLKKGLSGTNADVAEQKKGQRAEEEEEEKAGGHGIKGRGVAEDEGSLPVLSAAGLLLPQKITILGLPCPAMSYPTLSCPVLSCPVLPCPALSCPTLSCPFLSCPDLSYLVLSCPALSCPALSYSILFYPVLPCTVLHCPALPCFILSCHFLLAHLPRIM